MDYKHHTPEQYIKAIQLAEQEGMEAIIIDSLSHSWEYLLDYHSKLSGNSFANWAMVTPRYKVLVHKVLDTNTHIISTLRVKQDYVLTDKNGKIVPEKIGLKAIQRDGLDYEFTVAFNLDISHHATCAKDRTGLFIDQPAFTIDEDTGKELANWCMQGIKVDDIKKKIAETNDLKELTNLYEEYRVYFPVLKEDFVGQKKSISQLITSKVKSNGITSH